MFYVIIISDRYDYLSNYWSVKVSYLPYFKFENTALYNSNGFRFPCACWNYRELLYVRRCSQQGVN